MLVIQAARRLRPLPSLILLGLALMAAGGVMDVLVHGMSTAQLAHDVVTGEHVAHLLGIAGMTVVLAGVVIHGARRSRRPRAALEGGLDHNAHR